MFIGTVAACAHGAAMPVMMIVFGDMSDLFIYNAQWEYITNTVANNISNMCTQMCSYDITWPTSNSTDVLPQYTGVFTQPSPSPSFCTPGSATTVSPLELFNSSACDWCQNVTAEYINDNIDEVM